GIKDGALVLDTTGEKKPLVIRGFFRDDDGFEDSYAKRGVPDRSDVKTAVSPDERLLLAGDYSTLGIWDLKDGSLIRRLPAVAENDWGHSLSFGGNPKGSHFRIMDVCFSPQGHQAIVISIGGGLKFFDIRSGRLEKNIDIYKAAGRTETHGIVYGMRLSPGGTRLYICREDRIDVWNAVTQKKEEELLSMHRERGDFCLSPDGTLFATGEPDGIRIWSLSDKRLLAEFPALKPGRYDRCLAFSADSSLLYAVADGSIHVIALRRELQKRPDLRPESAALKNPSRPSGPPENMKSKPSRRELNRLKR
ncbi:MAG: hypothetical protein J5564_07480, partial [Clostridia bacterium]|nr:hypothetical protein [Clostridia bacterium]